MRHRAALFLQVFLPFIAAYSSPARSGGEDWRSYFACRKVGQDWLARHDSGYFRIVSDWKGEALALHAEPSPGSKTVKPLDIGDIVASEGIVHRSAEAVWQEVTADVSDGWVPKRVLVAVEPRAIKGTDIPSSGSCWGFVPTWSMSWNPSTLHVSFFPGGSDFKLGDFAIQSKGEVSLLLAQTGEASYEFVHTGEVCAPVEGGGRFGRVGVVILRTGMSIKLLTGCCQADLAAFVR